MNEQENLLGRKFYENEASLTWARVKNALPEPMHIDIASQESELRVFLFASKGRNPTIEFINFGLTEDKKLFDASYIMKNYDYLDFCSLTEEEAKAAWDKYKCQDFIDSGAHFDTNKTEAYNIFLNKKGE
jgi:hypothetical protein